MKDIKAYRPSSTSVSQGQVLMEPYPFEKARVIIREMADTLALELVEKGMVASAVTLYVGYDLENLRDGTYKGAVKTDWYGRSMPRSLNKSMRLERPTSSSSVLIDNLLKLCDEFLDRRLTVRRINISLSELKREDSSYQPTLFDESADEKKLERERRLQEATLRIKDRWGRNAILRALDYTDGATQRDRNNQIGGHKA